MLYKDWHWTVY